VALARQNRPSSSAFPSAALLATANESGTTLPDLHPVWHAISDATMAAAASLTLATMAKSDDPPNEPLAFT